MHVYPVPDLDASLPATAEALDAAMPAIRPEAWGIDPEFTFLNHGSFGACPKFVLARQQQLRDQLEANPLRFFSDEAPPLLDHAREAVAGLIRVPAEDLVFVHNATSGVNTVLRSLDFEPGDEILMFDHAYGSCANVVQHVCRRTGAVPVIAKVQWPHVSPQQVLDAVASKVTSRTRLAMLDHVTSLSALVMPMRDLADMLHGCGVDVLVDGAHAPGMIELDVASMGVAYYTGNCHKWLCGPKAAGVLYVRPDKQGPIEPAVLSEGSRFDFEGKAYLGLQKRFEWQATCDPTPAICVTDAIAFLSSLLPGGISELMARNHAYVVAMRRVVCEQWGVPEPCPASMLGSMAAMPICRGYGRWDPSPEAQPQHAFVRSVRDVMKMECQAMAFGEPPMLQARLSCQAYNHGGQALAFSEAFREKVDPTVYDV